MGAKIKHRVVLLIDISLIRVDRYPMNPSTLDIIYHIKAGGSVAPIKVAKHPCGGYVIRDGRHRLLAHKMLGIKKIKAKFSNKKMNKYESNRI